MAPLPLLALWIEARERGHVRARPLITAHVAQSLDGRLAIDGTRTLLSTPEGQRAAHDARSAHDAVLVGSRTIQIDDPRLTVRHAIGRDPLRVILATRLDVPSSSRALGGDGKTIVFGARGLAGDEARLRLEERGAEVTLVGVDDDGVSLRDVLLALRERGVERLLVEGGGRVLTSFFRQRLVDRVEIEISMKLLGAPGTPTLGALHVREVEGAIELTNVAVEMLGANILVRADVVKERAS